MIRHQLSAAAACDRILVMSDGKIVQEGTHQYLIKKEEKLLGNGYLLLD